MTKPVRRCAWCGERFAAGSGLGRPRKYCRRSHRQRHYEARQDAVRHQLGDDDVLIRRTDMQRLRDHQYLLEAALADARQDLVDAALVDACPEAFETLAQAVEQMIAMGIEPKAIGG